jgi:short-subunit dehydrogenase
LETLAKSLKERCGVAAGWIASDIGNPIELDDLVRTIAADRSLTLLVNNAGISTLGKVVDSTPENLAAMINVNIVALTRLSIAVLAGFKERNRGTILSIGSVLGLHSLPISSIYSGTKAYVLNFTRGLRDEVAGTGVRVQLVLSAAMATDIWEISGVPLSQLDPSTVMTAEDAVNATLGEGASIVVNYASSKERAEKVVATIAAASGNAIAVRGDVSKAADAQGLIDSAIQKYDRLDVVVNNSGIYGFATLEEITEEAFHKSFNINVRTPVGNDGRC